MGASTAIRSGRRGGGTRRPSAGTAHVTGVVTSGRAVGSAAHLLEESPRLGWTAATALVALRRLDASTEPNVRSSSWSPCVTSRPHRQRAAPRRSFGILSTFPPTPCGIATFSAALAAGLVANGATVDVVRCGRRAGASRIRWSWPSLGDGSRRRHSRPPSRRSTAPTWPSSSTSTASTAAPTATTSSTSCRGVVVPSIVVAHTVVRDPTPHQRAVLEQVCDAADAVVVMTESARDRLVAGLRRRPGQGDGDPPRRDDAAADRATDQRPARSPSAARLLTWGLLGPGKGIEWAIDAMAQLVRPSAPPDVPGRRRDAPEGARAAAARRTGEMLVDRAGGSPARRARSSFDDTYRDLAALTRADPLRRRRRAARTTPTTRSPPACSSTPSPPAVRWCRRRSRTPSSCSPAAPGIVVPQRDPDALAAAIRTVLTDTG